MDGPLQGRAVAAAGAVLGRLLGLLGADVTMVDEPAAEPADEPGDWARSGLAAVTGRPGGPDLTPRGAPATFARACGLGVELLSAQLGRPVRVDGVRLLGSRAGALGLRRGGDRSAGGAARLLPARDGWWALSLPRPEDLDLVPALVCDDRPGEPWEAVRAWSAGRTVAAVTERAALLGLAAGAVPATPVPAPVWRIRHHGRRTAGPAGTGGRPGGTVRRSGGPAGTVHRPGGPGGTVVNLGSLWAAPLCAQLLHLGGYRVIDVESPQRPDGVRAASPEVYRTLHDGHERAVIELATPAGRAELAALLRGADVVITGSRSAALHRLGATRQQVAAPADQVWISITGHGPDSPRVAFGDDAAATGGLLAWDDAGPVFVGDAIADPLTGLAAALGAYACLLAEGSWTCDLALRDVAAAAATS